METAEAATLASAFVDNVCFQASQVPMPCGRAWESGALLWQRESKLSPVMQTGHPHVQCTRWAVPMAVRELANILMILLSVTFERLRQVGDPDDWKEANGTPILPREGQGEEDQGKCRLISLRTVFGNLTE